MQQTMLTVRREDARERIDGLIAQGRDIAARLQSLPPFQAQATVRGFEESDALKSIKADHLKWLDKAEQQLLLMFDSDEYKKEFDAVKHAPISPDKKWNVGALLRTLESSLTKLESIRGRLPDVAVAQREKAPEKRAESASKTKLSNAESDGIGGLVEWFKRSRIGQISLIGAACVGITWKIQNELIVEPREFYIKELEAKLAIAGPKRSTLHAPNSGDGQPVRTEPETASPDSIYVLLPTTVMQSGAIHAFSNQVLISVQAYGGRANVSVKTPETEEAIVWRNLEGGDRKEFTYKGNSYFVDIVSVKLVHRGISQIANRYSATVSITRNERSGTSLTE